MNPDYLLNFSHILSIPINIILNGFLIGGVSGCITRSIKYLKLKVKKVIKELFEGVSFVIVLTYANTYIVKVRSRGKYNSI